MFKYLGEYLQIQFKKYYHFTKRTIKCICNILSIYSNFYTIYNSLKFDDIVKMNSIEFMFRAKNNILPNHLLYTAKSYNGNLFHDILCIE